MGNKTNKIKSNEIENINQPNKYTYFDNNLFFNNINKDLTHLLEENIKLLSLIISSFSGELKGNIIHKIKENFKYHNVVDDDTIKNEIEYNDKILLNLLKQIYKNEKVNFGSKNIEKINDILNSLLKEENNNIKNEFLFLCKLNLIKFRAEEEYYYFSDNKIKFKNGKESKNGDINKNKLLIKNNNNSNTINKYSVWNDSQKMEKLFHHKNIKSIPIRSIISIKIINNNKLITIEKNGSFENNKLIPNVKIYDINKNKSLLLKVKLDIDGPILILKNKNYAVISKCGKFLFVLDKNKLKIIEKIYLFTEFLSSQSNSKINIYNYEGRIAEISDQSIAYTNKLGITIYKKINNKYIFYKFIISQESIIINFNLEFFIIKSNQYIYTNAQLRIIQ